MVTKRSAEKFSSQPKMEWPWTIKCKCYSYIHPTVKHTWHSISQASLALLKKKEKLRERGYSLLDRAEDF